MILLLLSAGTAGAQPVSGQIIECRDRPQLLLKAGYVAPYNDADQSGISGRAMVTLHCDPGGREGVEVGFFGVPFVERRYPRNGSAYQTTADGTGMFAQYAGIVTERSLPGLPRNLQGVLGVGFYGAKRRVLRESVTVWGSGSEQVSRYDGTNHRAGVGANVGVALLINATSTGAVHLDARQHLSGAGVLFSVSAGILF
jgi:hypothetical protein